MIFMKKQIKKVGSSLCIRFNKDEIIWHNLKEGEWLEVDIIKIKMEDKRGKNDSKINKR